MCEKRDDEYYGRCTKIRTLLCKSYVDKALLNAIEMEKPKILQGSSQVKNVFNHLCEMIKCDIVLNLWKIYIDNNKNANTIQHLNSYLNKNERNLKQTIKISTEFNQLLQNIKKIRKQCLAHLDFQIDCIEIDLPLLYKALNEIKDIYNGLCDNTIDGRVQKISLADIVTIDITSSIGLASMCHNDTKKTAL